MPEAAVPPTQVSNAPQSDRVGSVQRQLFLRSLGADRTGPTLNAIMSRQIKDRFVPVGAELFRVGAAPLDIFFILKGEVELRSEDHEPWLMTAPAVIGAFDALHERPHTRTAVAVTDLHLLALKADEWFDTIEENFEVARDNMHRVAEGTMKLMLEVPPDGAVPEPAGPAGEPTVGLNLVERILLFRQSSAFAAAPVQALARLAEIAEELEIPAGQVIHAPDAPTDSFYLVASGMIEIALETPGIRARFGAGQIVYGGLGVGLLVPPFETRAVAPTVLLAVRREDFFDIMEDNFELTRSVMKGVTTQREEILTQRAERAGQRRSTSGTSIPPMTPRV